MYSIKLKLEFSILNRLISVVRARNPSLFNDEGTYLGGLGGDKASASQNVLAKEVDVDSMLLFQSPIDLAYFGNK